MSSVERRRKYTYHTIYENIRAYKNAEGSKREENIVEKERTSYPITEDNRRTHTITEQKKREGRNEKIRFHPITYDKIR